MEEQDSKRNMTEGMSVGQKISYYWYYYKWIYLLIAAAIIFAIVVGKTAYDKMSRDVLLHIVGANSEEYTESCEEYFDKFLTEYNYENNAVIETDFSISINEESSSEGAMALQLLAALFSGGDVDIFISDSKLFDDECERNAFISLDDFLPQDMLEKYSDRLYYATDAKGNSKPYGLSLKDTKLTDSGLALYKNEDNPVVGIGSQYSVEEINILRMLEYLL